MEGVHPSRFIRTRILGSPSDHSNHDNFLIGQVEHPKFVWALISLERTSESFWYMNSMKFCLCFSCGIFLCLRRNSLFYADKKWKNIGIFCLVHCDRGYINKQLFNEVNMKDTERSCHNHETSNANDSSANRLDTSYNLEFEPNIEKPIYQAIYISMYFITLSKIFEKLK
jgi:hypothetical protein